MRFILQDAFWFVHVLFCKMIQFQFLSEFPLSYFPYPVAPCLILILCYSTAFTFICSMIFFLSPHSVILRFFLIHLVLMALFCTAIQKYSVSLLRFPSGIPVSVFCREISLVCHFKCPYSCFSYHSYFLVIAVLFVLSLMLPLEVEEIHFFPLFDVITDSSYWCIYATVIAGESPASFFYWHL